MSVVETVYRLHLRKLEGTGQDAARAGSEDNPFILPLNEEPSWGGGLL